jgi:hypothetical protein
MPDHGFFAHQTMLFLYDYGYSFLNDGKKQEKVQYLTGLFEFASNTNCYLTPKNQKLTCPPKL